MKLVVLSVGSPKDSWFVALKEQYEKKISAFVPFEIVALKSKNLDRRAREQKRAQESKEILSAIKDNDYVILCDEHGLSVDSLEFSKKMVKGFESGRRQLVFIIGGPYGVDDTVKKRAQWVWSFSNLTFNHLLAHAIVFEQLYRGLTIWKGVPYHND